MYYDSKELMQENQSLLHDIEDTTLRTCFSIEEILSNIDNNVIGSDIKLLEKEASVLKSVSKSIETTISIAKTHKIKPIVNCLWALSAFNENTRSFINMEKQLNVIIKYMKLNKNIPILHVNMLFGILINISRTTKGKQLLIRCANDLQEIIDNQSYGCAKENAELLSKLLTK